MTTRFADQGAAGTISLTTSILVGSQGVALPGNKGSDVYYTFTQIADWIASNTFTSLNARLLNAPSAGNTPNTTAISTFTTGGAAGTEMQITFKGTHYWGGDLSTAFASLDANMIDGTTGRLSVNSASFANFQFDVAGLIYASEGVSTLAGNLNLNSFTDIINLNNNAIINGGDAAFSQVTTDYAYVGGIEGNDPSKTLVISPSVNGTDGQVNFNQSLARSLNLALGSNIYTAGTYSQSGFVVTGVGTTWTADMVPGLLLGPNGELSTIIGFTDATHLIAAESRSYGGPLTYALYYDGLQVGGAGGYTTTTTLQARSVVTPILSSPSGTINLSGSNITNGFDGTFTSTLNVPQINTSSGELKLYSFNGVVNLINAVNPGVSDLVSEYMHAGVEVIAQASDYTLSANDWNTHQSCTKATAQVITIPANATIPAVIGTWVSFAWDGVGQPSFTPDGGVTLNSQLSNRKISAQYCGAVIIKTAINTWSLFGALTA